MFDTGALYKVIPRTAAAYMANWGKIFFDQQQPVDHIPLRAELFSVDQMEEHGKVLARTHVVLEGTGTRDRLLKRLDDNEQVLIETCNMLMAAVKSRHRIAPAGEWLLDNFHLIEDQIRTARLHLPKGYYRELPLLGQ